MQALSRPQLEGRLAEPCQPTSDPAGWVELIAHVEEGKAHKKNYSLDPRADESLFNPCLHAVCLGLIYLM